MKNLALIMILFLYTGLLSHSAVVTRVVRGVMPTVIFYSLRNYYKICLHLQYAKWRKKADMHIAFCSMYDVG